MGAAQAKAFPLDFTTLEKGTWLEGKRLDDALLVKRNHPMWSLEVSKLCDRIFQECEIYCRADHDRVRLMTDEEASEYGWRRFSYHVRGLGRQKRKLASVDINKLEPEQRTLHEHRLRASTGIAMATRSAMKKESRILALLSGTTTVQEDGEKD